MAISEEVNFFKDMERKSEVEVSVIIPCFNQAHFLPEALASVFEQTLESWECIIVNDGSTDETEEIAKRWCEKDPRFKYLSTENNGLSSARNLGLREAYGKWIQFLDADDYLEKDKLRASTNQYKKNSSLNLILTNFKCFEEVSKSYIPAFCKIDRKINLETILLKWDLEFVIPIHCAIFSRELLNGGFNEDLKAKEDWLMWINVFSSSVRYAMINSDLVVYRIHKSSMSKDSNHMEINTLEAYKKIYDILPNDNLTLSFFKRVMSDVQATYKIKNDKILSLQNSLTYRLGHIILKPFKLIRHLM